MTRGSASKNPDWAEIKKSLDHINNRLDDLSQCKSEVSELLQLVRQLKHKNEEKDKRILLLESCIDDLEQYTRMDDVIISGLKTNHKSYARAASPSLDYTNGPLAPQGELENLESCVTRFVQDKMGVDYISA